MRTGLSDPTVSIILPTYNRATFLSGAFESIRSQTFADWELIVVDDGSTDGTQNLVSQLAHCLPQPVRYVRQANGGHAAARNTGISAAVGEFLAFHDSDDEWLPHHLMTCVRALRENKDTDWIYGSSKIVHSTIQSTIASSSFYDDEKPRPFLNLRVDRRGDVAVIADTRVVEYAIRHGLYCGLQNSLLRRECFDHVRLINGSMADDQLFTIEALKSGIRIAYLDQVHLIYRVHEDNVSGASGDTEKLERVMRQVIADFEDLRTRVHLTPNEDRSFRQRLLQEYFWKLGYSTLWRSGQRTEALQMFRRGLRYWPWSWKCWKTYFLAAFRKGLGLP